MGLLFNRLENSDTGLSLRGSDTIQVNMKVFSKPVTEANYRRLGFAQDDLSFKLCVGNVSVYAVEHLWKGVVLTFESFTSRSMCQYDVSLPEKCSVEQIAGMIYMNISTNHRESAGAWKSYFEQLGVALFQ